MLRRPGAEGLLPPSTPPCGLSWCPKSSLLWAQSAGSAQGTFPHAPRAFRAVCTCVAAQSKPLIRHTWRVQAPSQAEGRGQIGRQITLLAVLAKPKLRSAASGWGSGVAPRSGRGVSADQMPSGPLTAHYYGSCGRFACEVSVRRRPGRLRATTVPVFVPPYPPRMMPFGVKVLILDLYSNFPG